MIDPAQPTSVIAVAEVALAVLALAPWRVWAPVLDEAEILRCGGVSGWWAAAYLVAFAGLFALVFKARALRRIGVLHGFGTRCLVLGLLLPPVWAGERHQALAAPPIFLRGLRTGSCVEEL